MLRGCVSCLVVLAGCGRVGFDASGGDAAIDAGVATRCGQIVGELFCESFEGPAKLPTVQFTPPGFVVTDTSRPFRGAQSLHTGTDGPGQAWQLGAALPDLTAGELYARWYIYLPSGPATVELASVHIVDAVAPYAGFVVGGSGGRLVVASTKNGETHLSNALVARDRWLCVQLHASLSTTGVVETWLDGVMASQLTAIDTVPVVSLKNVHAGMFATGLATEPMELWTDELAVGSAPIPCD